MKKMKDKIVLITGASSGIGAETAKAFASLGATVLLLARNETRLNQLADTIRTQAGQAIVFPVDVGNYDAVVAMANKVKQDIGVPDVIINNAGSGLWRFVEETTAEQAIESIKVPYLAAFFVTKVFMPELLKRNSGHIVNMTSFAAKIPFSGATAYISSRKAMIGLHEALTMDLHGTGIKTSLTYFAKVESSFWEHNPGSEERLPLSQKLIPVISEQQAAQAIVRGVLKGKREISSPFMLKIILFLTWLTPYATRFIMYKTGYKRKATKISTSTSATKFNKGWR
jgi:short-subunit dehydrogenase